VLLDRIYNKVKLPSEVEFDELKPSFSIFQAFSTNDFVNLHDIASSIRYSGKLKKKKDAIDKIMTARGFVKFASGTNRVIYRPIEFNDIIVKVPVDHTALTDNPAEFINQQMLKPFCSKIFEVAPEGTMLSAERGRPITHTQEFLNIASDVYDIITNYFIGKYVMADFGTNYFMNWAVFKRGPGIIDFPYVYPMDGGKVFCTHVKREDPSRTPCMGHIGYDDGFNELICDKCGRRYNARDLSIKTDSIKIIGGNKIMKSNERIILRCGDQIIKEVGGEKSNQLDDGVDKIDISKLVAPKVDGPVPHKYDVETKTVNEGKGFRLLEVEPKVNKNYQSFIAKKEEITPLKKVIVIEDKVVTQEEYDSVPKLKDVVGTKLKLVADNEMVRMKDEISLKPIDNNVIDKGDKVDFSKLVVAKDEIKIKAEDKAAVSDGITIRATIDTSTGKILGSEIIKETPEEIKADSNVDESIYTIMDNKLKKESVEEFVNSFEGDTFNCVSIENDDDEDDDIVPVELDEDYQKIQDTINPTLNEDESLMDRLQNMANDPNSIFVKNLKKEEQNDKYNNESK
jgi:hypothetical protein